VQPGAIALNRANASRPAPAEFVAGGCFVDVAGGRLFTISAGESSERQPVVFLHGIPTWSWIWRNVIEASELHGLSIAIDLPGFGLSTLDRDRRFTISTIAGMLEQAIDHLAGDESHPVLVAHDFGVLVAAELIARAPDRYSAVVITNSSLRPESWIGSGWGIDLLAPLRIPVLGQLSMATARPWMLRWAAAPYVADPVDPGWFQGFWYPFEHGFGQSLARFYQSQPVQFDDFARWRCALEEFTRPSLVVWGMCDPAFGGREFADIVSILDEPETLVVERASHFLMEDRPRVLARTIARFLTRLSRAAGSAQQVVDHRG
jgi:pimeloyl-ACP methyl ester carboxylesterase